MVTLDLMVLIAYMVGILAAGDWAKRKVTSRGTRVRSRRAES